MNLFPPRLAALALLAVLLAGCTTRSISNSDFDHQSRTYARAGSGTSYQGELSEFDVVGVEEDRPITEEAIRAALSNARSVHLSAQSRILLIQSGAAFPDDDMMSGLRQHYQVQPFSGIPTIQPRSTVSSYDTPPVASQYSKALRMAAAHGGYDKIVCYWGVLESQRESNATKLISWVPIAGNWLPDEKQTMRIRLRAVIVDVDSGRWSYVAPGSVSSKGLSSYLTRRNTDQSLVMELKSVGYQKLVAALADRSSD
jgi:hypothetical protein